MKPFVDNIPLFLTIVSALAGLLGWGAARIRRGYGLERDINHLKRDYEALNQNSARLFEEYERRLDVAERQLAVLSAINEALIGQRHKREADQNT